MQPAELLSSVTLDAVSVCCSGCAALDAVGSGAPERGFRVAMGLWVAFGVRSGENGRALGSRHLLGVRFGDVWWGVVELGVTTGAAGLCPGQVGRALFVVGVVIAGSLLHAKQ